MQHQPPMLRFDPPPPFTKKILIGLLGLFVVELILENWIALPLASFLAWDPTQTLIRPWQVLTHFLYQGSKPLSFLFDLLAIYFFLPTMQQNYGRKGIYRLASFVVFTAAIFGIITIMIGAVVKGSPPAMGISPFVTAMIVVFGLTNPKATILLIIFPIQAAWIAWGTGLFAALGFLSTRTLPSALWLAGWLAGYAFIEMRPGGKLRRFFIRRKHKQTNRRLKEQKIGLTVHDGGKDDVFH